MIAPKNIEQENKQKPSLIPWDIILEFDEPPYREGLLKYYRESWRKGFKVSDMMDACLRHLIKFFYDKEDYDQETWEKYKIKKHHVGAARFCLACICQTLKEHPELDDRRKDWSKDKKECKSFSLSLKDIPEDFHKTLFDPFKKGRFIFIEDEKNES